MATDKKSICPPKAKAFRRVNLGGTYSFDKLRIPAVYGYLLIYFSLIYFPIPVNTQLP